MKKISMLLLICMGFSGGVFAEENANSAGTIAELNEKNAILAARIKLVDSEVQMAQKQAELAKLKGTSNLDKGGLPSLRSIEGVNGSMYATLTHSDGGSVTVEKGETLPGGWVVESIQPRGVTLAKGRERERLILRSASSRPAAATGLMPVTPGR